MPDDDDDDDGGGCGRGAGDGAGWPRFISFRMKYCRSPLAKPTTPSLQVYDTITSGCCGGAAKSERYFNIGETLGYLKHEVGLLVRLSYDYVRLGSQKRSFALGSGGLKERNQDQVGGNLLWPKNWAPKNDYAVGIRRISDFFH